MFASNRCSPKQYRETLQRGMIVLAEGKLEEAEKLFDRVEALGSYVPVFSGTFAPNTVPRPSVSPNAPALLGHAKGAVN